MARIKQEARRSDILQTAFKCFTQCGYSKTSLDFIAQKTGISRPLIYQHFKDKEDLFANMMEERFKERYTQAEQSLSLDAPKQEKLLAFTEILILKDWSAIASSFAGIELFNELNRVLPNFEAKYRKKFIDLAASVLGSEELAEVFRFSLSGLTFDIPPVSKLRKRIKILIDCVVCVAG